METKLIGNAIAQSPRFAGQASGISVTAAPAATSAGEPEQAGLQPSPIQLTQAVASINQTMQKLSPGLEFSVDRESNRTIVKVVDKQTNELIRQMPSAETIEIAKALDRVQGLLISLRA